MEKTLGESLKKLITFKTVSGRNEEITRAFAWVKEELSGLPVFIREYTFNEVPALVITTTDTKNPRLWLAAHMDVVDGSTEVWNPKEEDGRISGRGAFDMKFAIACYIELFKELGQALSDYDIGIMLTGDEEVGGFNGVSALLNQEGYRGDMVFLPDGGGTWQFEESAKGLWRFDITATGKAAHSSRLWEGESATKALLNFMQEICREGDSFWQDTSEHWHLTYNVGMLNGGLAANQVASSAQAVVDVRFATNEEYTLFERSVQALLAHHPAVSIQTIWYTPVYTLSRNNVAAQSFAHIAKNVAGIECGWAKAHGASDARHFSPFGIPVILIFPKAGGMHAEDEWIDLADLNRFYTVLREWAKETAGHMPVLAATSLTMTA